MVTGPAPADARPGQRPVRHRAGARPRHAQARARRSTSITDARRSTGLGRGARPTSGPTSWWSRATRRRRSPPRSPPSTSKVPVAARRGGPAHRRPVQPVPGGDQPPADAQLAALHLAPTPTSRANLLAENVDPPTIVVTGNTVIDALLDVVARDLPLDRPGARRPRGRRARGPGHQRTGASPGASRWRGRRRALARLATAFPDTVFVLPAHLNPVVREVLLPPLAGLANVRRHRAAGLRRLGPR